MQKRWTLEMYDPGGGRDSPITTDRFDDFADNREMVFVVKPLAAPLTEYLRMPDDLKIRIENRAPLDEDDALLRKQGIRCGFTACR
jgi:hypothetical protein